MYQWFRLSYDHTILLLVCLFFFLADEFSGSYNFILERIPSHTGKARTTATVSIHTISRNDPLGSSMSDADIREESRLYSTSMKSNTILTHRTIVHTWLDTFDDRDLLSCTSTLYEKTRDICDVSSFPVAKCVWIEYHIIGLKGLQRW